MENKALSRLAVTTMGVEQRRDTLLSGLQSLAVDCE